MKLLNQIIFCFIAGGLYSCETYYVPEIEQYSDALVVEGMLTDQNEIVKIILTRSASFIDASYFYVERNARVTIESESGKSYPTSDMGMGIYKTKEPVPTQAGEGYFVKIITYKGEEYRSKIEKMPASNPLDSIYLSDSILREVNFDYWGDPIVKDYNGINISVRPKATEEGVGFIYKWNALVNYFVKTSDNAYYCWKVMSPNAVCVYDYAKDDHINELPLGDVHFLSYQRLSPLPLDTSRFSAPVSLAYSTSFYYHLSQYAITRDGTKFWRSVKNQSEASGKLFDPIEEQIVGNIYCVSDSSKIAFGYFNTSSFSEKFITVKLTTNSFKDVNTVNIIPVTQSDEDCYFQQPDFWY